MATVEAVCTSDKKGIVKKERDRVILKANWGIEGDAHAGDWHRQVSLLASESIELVREQLPTLKKGAFAENIITRGIDLEKIGIGRKIQIGASAVLEITQIGKECHNSGCAIKKATGDCIMPREGLFAKVIEGGSVSPGDDIVAL
ncbi:MAG: MOSC domain-containing protein [Desulfobulbaceae bacterium]|nr:MOSC domain-containing protein [Desulfofustis sp.]NNK56119.1 MOSC domain-containing protein [Desulfofustis sp.]RZW26786.1 MAG: MOSC domain-containing protein [Desulfobulbaceae bacterium]